MTNNTTILNFASPTDLILPIPPDIAQRSESFSNPTSLASASLNKLCLNAVLPWLQEDLAPQAKPWPSITALPSFWEFVNGTAISIDGTRFVLVPSEAMDLGEMRVAQEWVDIPSFVGDYYLAVQVEPDDGYVRIWGYCTHEQVKSQGSYDSSDRTYSVDNVDMINDISVLMVAQQFCQEETTRRVVPSLPTLLPVQAQNLISRLQTSHITPRLEIPFQLWGALIEHGGWRQSLYQRRLGLQEQWSILEWVESGVSQFARSLGWGSLSLQLSGAGVRSVEEIQSRVAMSRQLMIAGQLYDLTITAQNEGESTWHFELRNATVGAAIPGGFKLRLLTEDLQPFPNNEDVATTAVELLFVDVALQPGEGIVWEIEPLPENYDREILRF
ncbi:MAG: DUF1822 family protein [Rhizonema sp. PD37]|nr:DUF1822 family protein [Rhizonema sp. PD37]